MPLRVKFLPSESVLGKACYVCSPTHLIICLHRPWVWAFSRARPIAVFGQDAKSEGRSVMVPESANQRGREIVGVNFTEQLFRYCADDRFRFFILEQDFRFYASDTTAFERIHAKKHGEICHGMGLWKPSDELLTKLRSAEPTPELKDLLATVTAARRWATPNCPHGHHNLIWLGWEPFLQGSPSGHYQWPAYKAEKRDFVPGTGNYLWWITARGARYIKRKVLAPPACLPPHPTPFLALTTLFAEALSLPHVWCRILPSYSFLEGVPGACFPPKHVSSVRWRALGFEIAGVFFCCTHSA